MYRRFRSSGESPAPRRGYERPDESYPVGAGKGPVAYELYDLKADPQETTDLAEKSTDRVAKMKAALTICGNISAGNRTLPSKLSAPQDFWIRQLKYVPLPPKWMTFWMKSAKLQQMVTAYSLPH